MFTGHCLFKGPHYLTGADPPKDSQAEIKESQVPSNVQHSMRLSRHQFGMLLSRPTPSYFTES